MLSEIRFQKLTPSARLPEYAHADDAGMDIFSDEDYLLKVGERHIFKTGIASSFANDYCVFIKPKSGLAAKAGIDVLAGVVDPGYRGEWGVVLINLGQKDFQVRAGDKIAQAVMFPVVRPRVQEADSLEDSDRGSGGFGSTGR